MQTELLVGLECATRMVIFMQRAGMRNLNSDIHATFGQSVAKLWAAMRVPLNIV